MARMLWHALRGAGPPFVLANPPFVASRLFERLRAAIMSAMKEGTILVVTSGYVIIVLVGLCAAVMPVIHMRRAHYAEIARSAGGFFFVWTLWALGRRGGLTFILSARGLWSLRRGQPPR